MGAHMSALTSVTSLNPRGAAPGRDACELAERAARMQRRAEREHTARHEAERLLESKSLELFAANQCLTQLNADLERRVEARTKQLDDARKTAVRFGTIDYLTKVANRLHYSQQLEQSVARSGATGLLLVDLDGFKLVNDTYGHDYGDQLLITIAHRLGAITRRNDFVARIGGDEFAVILEGANAASIAKAALRFRRVFDEPLSIFGVTVQCRGSLGLAMSPDHCDNAVDLQRYADLALYRSKKLGGGEVVVFENQLLHSYEFRQRIESEFRAALAGGTIDLHYQPIRCIETDRVEAVEALARWTDSNGDQISPEYFIPLAEQCGIIRGVGHNLLEKGLLETKGWIEKGYIKKVSFNLSPLELLAEGFYQSVLSTLRVTGVPGCHVVFEITEGAVLQNLGVAEEVMDQLRGHGVRFALDDFGCGYSNLTTLSKLPISVLKIDRSLLVNADNDHAARIILRNVVTLCRELGLRSVCEGAETAAHMDFLREIGCEAVQGFASGRPGAAAAIEKVLLNPSSQN